MRLNSKHIDAINKRICLHILSLKILQSKFYLNIMNQEFDIRDSLTLLCNLVAYVKGHMICNKKSMKVKLGDLQDLNKSLQFVNLRVRHSLHCFCRTGLSLPKETPVFVCLVFDEKGVHQLLVNPIRNLVRILKDDVLYLALASAYIILSIRLMHSSFWDPPVDHCLKELALSFAVSPSLLRLLTLVSKSERRSRDRVVGAMVPIVTLLPTDRATVTRRHWSRRGNRGLWCGHHRVVVLAKGSSVHPRALRGP